MAKYLVQELTLTQFTSWLNDRFKKKKSGQPFTINDAKAYTVRKHLPRYLGFNRIEKSKRIKGVNLYNVRGDSYGI